MTRIINALTGCRIFFLFFFFIFAGFRAIDSAAAQLPADNTEDPKRDEQKDQGKSSEPYNILLIMCDQESFRLLDAEGYTLPAREKLKSIGTSFENHYIASAMSTPSRGTIFTGQPPQVNGIFDQMEMGYVPSISTEKPSMGTIMKDLGYTTAYYGKFELDKDILYSNEKINYTDSLQKYGFDKFEPDGDKYGEPDQGYDTDNYSTGESIRWMRTNAKNLENNDKPWFMVLSLINPHDIMYADANLQGETVQKSKIGAVITPPPSNELYKRKWNFELWSSLGQQIDSPNRPKGQLEYHKGWSDFLGLIPNTRKDMWTIFYNLYLNFIKDSDSNIRQVMDTLDDLDLWENTIVVFTADHGELGGSHGGLRGKGPFPYEQMSHVPMVIVHPDYKGGKSCRSVTSHLDIIPTLVGLSGTSEDNKTKLLKGLPGHDFSKLLKSPEDASLNAVRKAALFNYVGLWVLDANYLLWSMKNYNSKDLFPPSLAKKHPDLSNRGFLSFVFDGRYKYARYFAPNKFNTPKTLEDIFKYNDVELFDLKNDSGEINNLAAYPEAHKELIIRMNNLLNEMIEKEVGANNGDFLPKPLLPFINKQNK